MATILIVEDNAMNRDMLTRRLQCVAHDGEQAVALAQAIQPDLILMDMRLPVLDGWAATRRIKALPSVQHIPVIGVTANVLAEDRERCISAGCVCVVPKPIEFDDLLAAMRAQLAQ
jgi:two-component system, cell cycle response regulator DivK